MLELSKHFSGLSVYLACGMGATPHIHPSEVSSGLGFSSEEHGEQMSCIEAINQLAFQPSPALPSATKGRVPRT